MAWSTVGVPSTSWVEVTSDDPDVDLPQALALDGVWSWPWNGAGTILVRVDQLQHLAGGVATIPEPPRPMPTLTRPTSEPFEPRAGPGQPLGEPWVAVVADRTTADPNADQGDLVFDKNADGWYSYESGGTWKPVGGAGAVSPLTLTAHTAGETPLVLQGAAGQTADLLDLKNSGGANVLRVAPSGQIVAPSILLSSAITPGWAILQLDASPSQAGALLYSQSGAQQWQLYQSPGDTHLYLRDIVNGRMLMTFTPGATTTAAVAEFNGSMQVDGQLKILGTDASPHLFVFDNGVQGANVLRLYDNAGGVVIMTTHPATGSLVANKGLAVGGNPSYGGGAGPMMFLTNATTDPSTNPIGGGILYCSAGALKYRGPSGTVTTLGPA